MNNFIAGGCSFTFGHELSDSPDGKSPSRKTWAYQLHSKTRGTRYICTATAGAGNTGIARRKLIVLEWWGVFFQDMIGPCLNTNY